MKVIPNQVNQAAQSPNYRENSAMYYVFKQTENNKQINTKPNGSDYI